MVDPVVGLLFLHPFMEGLSIHLHDLRTFLKWIGSTTNYESYMLEKLTCLHPWKNTPQKIDIEPEHGELEDG